MKVDNLAPSTIRHYVGALARCMDWAVNKKALAVNPIRLLPKRYSRHEGKSDEERDRRLEGKEEESIRAVLAGQKQEGKERALALNHRAALDTLFSLALETAMRMREMYTLTPDQVDLQNRTIFLDKTKNGSKRQVPLSTVAVKILKDYEPSGKYLFPWWDGKKSLPAVTALLSQQFSRIFEAAGCPDLRFHDIRHEATSRLFEKTSLSDLQIATITGHKSLSVLKRYANLRASDLSRHLW
jgi:integrase